MTQTHGKTDVLQTLQKAHRTIESLRQKLTQAAAQTYQPLAIVGMGCRFPGGAGDPSGYFRNLLAGVDAIGDLPPSRSWMRRRSSGAPAWGGWLDGIEEFDADFFGIAPVEARSLDPQQRLLLEASWEALEDAGLAPARLQGTRTGVFVGVYGHDYEGLLLGNPDRFVADIYARTGNGGAFAAGRISYLLGLEGPSLAVDTACSSSLVALHLACRSLRSGECNVAIAAGVNLILSPAAAQWLDHSPGLSADGRCRTFDAAADGFVRSEGCGAVVLKRLADAIADGDRITAVVRGTAVNQDGRSAGFTAPSATAQRAVIETALAEALVDPTEVGYVETHGSGTPLGDPIEIEALRAVYGTGASPCLLGAVKTQIGHLEAAAGIASVIKAALALQHGVVPKNLHFTTPNPELPIAGTRFVFPLEPTPFPASGARRVAAVSSFGMGGTNAHVILEQAPEPLQPAAAERALHVLAVSAKSEAGVRAAAERLAAQLERGNDPLADVSYTTTVRGSHLSARAAVLASDAREAVAELRALAARPRLDERIAARGGPVFVFSGHGSQWSGMARDLLEQEPVFRQSLEACDAAIRRCSDWSVLQLLARDAARIERGENHIVQPTLFAIGVGLAALWRSWGIEPSAVVGHSMGEIAAAHVAGVLSLEDAVRVVCRRSEVLARALGKGGMLLVELPLSAARKWIEPWRSEVSIAVNNSPDSCVLSGDVARLTEIAGKLEAERVFCRWVKVDYASHGPQMDDLRPALLEALSGITPREAAIPFHSTLTGRPLRGTECDPEYWFRNLREPVLFADVIQQQMAEHRCVFLELSPHPLLLASVEQNADHVAARALGVPSLQRDRPAAAALYRSLCALYAAGLQPDWSAVLRGGGRVISLPPRAWQRQRHWALDGWEETTAPAELASSNRATDSEPRVGLGTRLPSHADRPEQSAWEAELLAADSADARWGVATWGPALWCGLARAAVSALGRANPHSALRIEDARIAVAAAGDRVQTLATETDTGVRVRCFHRGATGAWTPVLDATWRAIASVTPPLAAAPERLSELSDWKAAAWLQEAGLDPARMPLRAVRLGAEGATARVELSAGEVELPLMAALERLGTLLGAEAGKAPSSRSITRADSLRISGDCTGEVEIALAVRQRDGAGLVVDASVHSARGEGVAAAEQLEVRPIDYHELAASADPVADRLYALDWRSQPARTEVSAVPGERWLVLGELGSEAALARELVGSGIDCTVLPDSPQASGHLHARLEAEPIDRLIYVVHAGSGERTEADALATERTMLRGLELLRAITASSSAGRTRLWLVTRGAIATREGERVDPWQACAWGLGRVIALEHPSAWGGLIDLAGDPEIDAGAQLARAMRAAGDEDQIAWRSTGPCVARLVASDLPPAPLPALRADRAYLITGGLGGLGLKLAHRLAAAGARHLVLVGRSALTGDAARRTDAIRGLEALGVTVTVAAVDIADRAQVQDLLAFLPRPLAGVFHVAGIGDMRPAVEIDAAQLARVMRPKVQGAWTLHELTRDLPLDYFVLFSSIAAVWGGRFEAHYAAANAFLDALVQLRRGDGLPATGVNWGYWASPEGMGNEYTDKLVRDVGTTPLPSELAFDALGRILASGVAQRTVAFMDWATFEPIFHARRRRRLLDEIAGHAEPPVSPAATEDERARLAALPAGEAREALQAIVAAELRGVLGIAATQALDLDRGFTDAGMDSITAVRFGKALERRLGTAVPTVALFEHPTARKLTEHIFTDVLGLGLPPSAARTLPEADDAPAFELDDLIGRLERKLDGRAGDGR